MRVDAKPAQSVEDTAARTATGRTLQEWYALIDDAGGTDLGRKGVNDLLFGLHKVDAWWTSTLATEYERSRGLKEKDGRPRGYAICVTKNIKAPATQVFEAFTDNARLSRWFGKSAQVQATEGGKWSDGDGHTGAYTKLAPGKTVRFTWLDEASRSESQVELKITEKSGVSGLVLNHERIQDRGEADGLRAAWGEAVSTLKAMLEGG
jgi:uncharacterized protein YndB with AHSA1/START domain